MDPGALAVGVVSLLTGYLSRQRDDLVDRVGDAAVNRLSALYGRLRDRLRHEPGAEAALEELATTPADARRQGALEFALTRVIERDAAFANQLVELLAAANEETQVLGTQITESGAVAIGGGVELNGTYVAGRDLTLGQNPSPAADLPPGQELSPDQR